MKRLLLPSKDGALLYILFFGYYPIVKHLAERIKYKALSWALKLLVMNAALTALWLFLRRLFAPDVQALSPVLIYLAANAAFCVYDIALSQLLILYAQRVSKYIRKNLR